MRHVFLIGAKSLGAYGGYETFINKLTEYHQANPSLTYHVAVKANGDGSMDPTRTEGARIINDREFIYHGAHCFRIPVPEKLGPAQAVYYDCKALSESLKIIRKEKISQPIIYVMACRIGPFFYHYVKKIRKLGGEVHLNPDGHEWMRAKWSKPVRRYWKLSEALMVRYADLVICDSVNIEKYIHKNYDGTCKRPDKKGSVLLKNPQTTFIAYGAETRASTLSDQDPRFTDWLKAKGLTRDQYYLVVGRFVPENNYETMIREFMKSKSDKNFAIITNVNDRFLAELEERLHFSSDPRIRFVGTVYDQELLMKIRENAYAYFHGHEVGGTNPSLLEALGTTSLNLLLDVGFNREVALDTALYWKKDPGNLAALIDQADNLEAAKREELGQMAKERIRTAYSWQYIADRYQEEWCR